MSVATQLMSPRDIREAQFEAEMQQGFASLVEVLETKGTPNTWLDIEESLGEGELPTRSGFAMSSEAAMRVAAVWACRRVIAEDVAKMPRAVKRKRRVNGELRIDTIEDHPAHRLLTRSPCAWLRPFEFVEWWVGNATMHRGAYALITRDGQGRPIELLPFQPGAVQAHQKPDWSIEYHINGYGQSQRVQPHELLRLHGPIDSTGYRGYAVSAMAREAVALAATIEASQARFHANDMRPSGALMVKGRNVTPELRDRIREDWQRRYGPGGDGGVAIVDEDFDFKTFTLNAGDSQVIENRRMQIEEICRYFRIFPQLVMHQGAQTYGNFEQALENHVRTTIMPWVLRVEEALSEALLTETERDDGFVIDLDVDAIARGTLTDRTTNYDRSVKIYLTPNEVREREGLNRIDDPAMDRVQLQANNTGLPPKAEPALAPKADARGLLRRTASDDRVTPDPKPADEAP